MRCRPWRRLWVKVQRMSGNSDGGKPTLVGLLGGGVSCTLNGVGNRGSGVAGT